MAITLYEYGLLWKAAGESQKAKEHFDKALEMFESMSMKLYVDRARKALEELNE